MPNPVTDLVTVISEHPQAAAAVASIYGVARPFLAKVLGPAAEEVGEIGRDYIRGLRARHTERTLAGADQLLAAAGREPQPVPLSTLVPLLESASLEAEPALADKWAALLANAADPAQRAAVQPAFVELLRQLTPLDAQIMQVLSADSAAPAAPGAPQFRKASAVRKVVQAPPAAFAVAADNLLRLRLCVGRGFAPQVSGSAGPEASAPRRRGVMAEGAGKEQLAVTDLGWAFLRAVAPPLA